MQRRESRRKCGSASAERLAGLGAFSARKIVRRMNALTLKPSAATDEARNQP